MTKNRLCKIESWLRVAGLTTLAGVGFVLLLHDLDADTPTMSMGWSLLARVAGAGVLYITYKVCKTLHKRGMLPEWLTQGEELEDRAMETKDTEDLLTELKELVTEVRDGNLAQISELTERIIMEKDCSSEDMKMLKLVYETRNAVGLCLHLYEKWLREKLDEDITEEEQ